MAREEQLVEQDRASLGIEKVVDVERIANAAVEAQQGMQKLVCSITSCPGAERTEAATATSNLLELEATHGVFSSVGGVQVLVKLLREGLSEEDSELATDALNKLSRNCQMHAVMLATGCIPVLVKRLQEGRDEEQGKATEALTNLWENEDSHPSMLASGAVDVLLKHTRKSNAPTFTICHDTHSGSETSAQPPASVQGVRSGAPASAPNSSEIGFNKLKSKTSKFLSGIVEYTNNPAELIVRAGGESLLKLLLRAGNPDEKKRTLTVLAKMAERWGYSASCLSKYIPQVATLVKDASSGVQVSAALLLGSLAKSDAQHRKVIGKSGVIRPLVRLLQNVEDRDECKVLRTLVDLSNYGENAVPLAEAGAMPVLVRLAREGNADVRTSAEKVVNNLTGCSQGLVALARADGVPIYLERLSTAKSLGNVIVAVTLNRLIECKEAVEIMGSELLLSTVIAMIRHCDWYDSRIALKHLARLSDNQDVLQVVVDAGIIPRLVELSHEYSTKESATKVLQLMAVYAEVRRFKRARLANEAQ